MNNTFNLQRFIWLFKKHTKEHYKTYLISTLVMIGFLVGSMCYVAYFEGLSTSSQEGLFAVFLIFCGSVFASLSFADLGQKNKAISMLTLPVSNLERFLVGWIYSFLIFQLLFVGCFYVLDIVVLAVINRHAAVPKVLIDLTSADTQVYYVFLYFWLLHAVAFLGSVVFQTLHFIKTAFVFLAFLIVLVFFNQGFVHLLIDGKIWVKLPFSHIYIQEGVSGYYLDDRAVMPVVMTVMLLISTFCLWIAAYFKLKEKQL